MKTSAKDQRFLGRGKDSLDIEITRAKGCYFYDGKGHKYLDFLMGWCVGDLGWDLDFMKKALKKFDGPDYVYPHLLYKPWADLAELLSSFAPGPLEKCFRTTGGTESVDIALQIAMAYTGRKKILSIEGAYHGDSLAALSIGASANRKKIPNLLPHCEKINPPLDEKALKKIKTQLKKKDVAAFIMEPVICNLGVMVPNKLFMKELQNLCRTYGTLLIMDEVATGFGRTGKLFASEHFELKPDIMCLAKAFSGGYAGIGATMTTKKIAEAVAGKISIYSTYGWHPLSTQAAMAHLHHVKKHQTELLHHVNKISELFHNRLLQMKFKAKAEISVAGLAIGVDVKEKNYAEKIRKKCLDKRLLIQADSSSLLMFPALNISEKKATKGLDLFESCI